MTRRSTMLPGMAPKSLVTGVLRRMAPRFLVIGAALVLAACAGEAGPEGPSGATGPAGPQGPPGEAAVLDVANLSCTECHNDTTVIVSKEAQFRLASVHGTGEAFERGGETNCAGCPGTFDKGLGNLCANCHQIRNELPVATGRTFEVTGTRFGTHYGVEAQMLL